MVERLKRLPYVFQLLLWIPLALILGFVVAKGGIMGVVAIIGAFLVYFFLIILARQPSYGFLASLFAAFFVNGLTRYFLDVPFGLSVDIILLVALIVSLFSKVKPEPGNLNNGFYWATLVWVAFTFMEVANPEARSLVAWFYAVRGVSLYQLFILTLLLLYSKSKKEVYYLTDIVIFVSTFAAFWGLKQLYFGLDSAEQAWMNAGAYKTHLLFGQLRVFSFYSDAGQFGASMGHAGLVALLMGFGPFAKKKKLIYISAGLICIYGMMISGTRGALFVPMAGTMGYLIGKRNFKIVLMGMIIIGSMYGFLKYTTLLNNNNQVRRMRSALDPNDASLQVRLNNQKLFKKYLSTRPIGGGIGSSGSWGQRFSPGTFLAETPNDSWYVKIWAETGVVGLSLHIAILLFFIGTGFWVIFSLHDPKLQHTMLCLHAGFIGIAVASYGNPILGQFPTGNIIYGTWAFLALAKKFDSEDGEVRDKR